MLNPTERADAALDNAREALHTALDSPAGRALVSTGGTAVQGLLLLVGGMLTISLGVVVQSGTSKDIEAFKCYLVGCTESLNDLSKEERTA